MLTPAACSRVRSAAYFQITLALLPLVKHLTRRASGTYLTESLFSHDGRAGKRPESLLGLHKEIKSPLQCPVEASLVVLLVRLRHPGERSRNLFLLASILGSGIDRRLRILHKHFHLVGRVRLDGSNEEFIVPCLLRVRVVLADVACGGLTLADLALPVLVGGRSTLEVEVFRERQLETLVQSLLVEIVRLLEIGKVAGDLRGTGEDHAGLDGMGGLHNGEG